MNFNFLGRDWISLRATVITNTDNADIITVTSVITFLRTALEEIR